MAAESTSSLSSSPSETDSQFNPEETLLQPEAAAFREAHGMPPHHKRRTMRTAYTRKYSEAQLKLREILQNDSARYNGVKATEADRMLVPKLHLLGMKRSGKTSILRTIFHRENARGTLFTESTREVTKEPKISFMPFDVWDFPASIDTHDPSSSPRTILSSPGSIIWVIDAQDEYFGAIELLAGTLESFAKTAGPDPKASSPTLRLPSHISIEVFIHKVDGLSNDFRNEIFRDIQQRITDEMLDMGLEGLIGSLTFHYTSIYDHSVFEAISKVIQKLIKPHFHATIEALVTSLCSNCQIEKAYLFDTQYKFYIASDTNPGDLESYETCSEYVDVVRDICQVYGWRKHDPNAEERYDKYHMESVVVMEKRGSKYLYMKAMNKFLTLVCIMGEDDPAERQPIIEYNVRIFEEGLNQVLDRLR